jgi:hypothetical protein
MYFGTPQKMEKNHDGEKKYLDAKNDLVEDKADDKIITKRAIISKLINLAIASAKVKSLVLEEEKSNVSIRPQINILIHGGIGSTKSTMLKEISKKINCPLPITDMTFPALVGSIDKQTRQIIPAMSWECKNTLMLMDEFSMDNQITGNAILQLAEGGEYSRKLSMWSMPTEDKCEDLFFKAHNGTISIKTRFSLIFATMRNVEYTQSKLLKALISRCLVIPYYPVKAELENIANGNPSFFYKEIIPKEKDVFIKKSDYNKIKKFVDESDVDMNNYLRTIGDCCRVYAVIGKHDEELYTLICSLKNIVYKIHPKKKTKFKQDD